MEKVRLTGDDAAIDAVAKMFGSVKSLNGAGDKSMSVKTKAGDVTPKEEPAVADAYDYSTEKHGAQLLRRAHEDHSFLMKDYDEALGQLENEDVRKHLEGHLGAVEKFLSSTEKLFGKHYKDYPPLAGLEEEDKDLTEVEDIQDELDEEVADTEEDKDLDTMDDAGNAAGSDSERDAEAPDGDEVIEGMEAEGKSLRAARAKYRRKGTCPGCGREDCDCQKGKRLPHQAEKIAPLAAAAAGYAAGQMMGGDKALEPHETVTVQEAAGFLGEAEQSPDWTDEHRFHSFHYHKTLKGIGQLAEAHDDLEAGTTDVPPAEFEPGVGAKSVDAAGKPVYPDGEPVAAGDKVATPDGTGTVQAVGYRYADVRMDSGETRRINPGNLRRKSLTKAAPGTPEWAEEEAAEPEHKSSHRKMCKDASDLFYDLHKAQALDDSQRGRMAEVRKQLEEIGTPKEETAELPEPGEMGEKAVNRIKAYYDEQEQQVKELTETLKALNGNVAV